MKRKSAIILSSVTACGIAVVALISRRSDAPIISNQSTTPHNSSAAQVTKLRADAASKKAIADAAASIARPAPPEPKDIENFFNRKIAQSGLKIEPKVTLPDGSITAPIVNEVGEMEYVKVEPEAKLSVVVHYPDGEVGEKVVVAPYDGGLVNGNKKGVEVLQLDESRNLKFDFAAGKNRGRYQIAIEKGGDEKVFRVWVGPEIPLAKQ